MTKEEFAEVRKMLGLTQSALAYRLGVTLSAVSRWENGARKLNPMAINFIRLMLKVDKNN